MTTQAEYIQANAVNGEMTDEQMTAMLQLPVGDTPMAIMGEGGTTAEPATPTQPTDPAEPGVPATPATDLALATPSTTIAPNEPAPAPVLLAKDGVHTIPYSELEDSRATTRSLAEQLATATATLEALQKDSPAAAPASTPIAPTAPSSGDFEVDLGDLSEDAIKNGIKAAVAAGMAARTAELQQTVTDLQGRLASVQATPNQSAPVQPPVDPHFQAINQAHPDIESIVPSQEFAAWRDSQPAIQRRGIQAVVDGGTAAEVIEVMNAYKAASKIAPAHAGAAKTPQQLADEAIARASSPTPTSLSEIPGQAGHHDATQALTDLSAVALMNRLSSQTPEQIMATMEKLL